MGLLVLQSVLVSAYFILSGLDVRSADALVSQYPSKRRT